MQAPHKHPKQILEELAQLDKKLEKLQQFFKASRTGRPEDSLLTKENIEKGIQLLEAINPEDTNIITALKALIPLAEKDDQALEKDISKPAVLPSVSSDTHEPYNQWTPRLKSKVPTNRVI